jgi:hypothetical protein
MTYNLQLRSNGVRAFGKLNSYGCGMK